MNAQEKFNGLRLKTARLYRGKTLDELAKDINVTKQAISQYENSDTIPESSKLFSLINVLRFPREYFFQEDTVSSETQTTYFRSLLGTHKKDRIAQIKKGEYIALLYDFLSEYIRFPQYNIPAIELPDNESNMDFDNIAKMIREYWNLGNEPVKDLVYQLEKSGIILTSLTATSKDIDAYSQKLKTENGNKYLIILTTDKEKRVRRQFSCAHELGHIILHNWNEDLESVSKAAFTEIENQANKFASAFLLPKDSFGLEVAKHPLALDYYIELKLKWNVSIAAMIIRARDLEIISYNQYQNLMRKYAYKGWKTCEPFDNELKTSNPTLLKSATKKILERKKWDGPTFIDMFSKKYNICLPKDEIEELLNLEKDTLKFNEQAEVIELPFKN